MNGILRTTFDPLYKKVIQEKESKNSTREKDEEVRRLSESGGRIVPLDSEAKGLEKSEEDLVVGVVSSKLYWDYLRSGLHSLAILRIVCICLITQSLNKSTLKRYMGHLSKKSVQQLFSKVFNVK